MSQFNKLVIAKFTAKSGNGDALLSVINTCKQPSRDESGNLYYDIYRSTENSNVFLIHEEWKGDAAIEFHFEQAHFKKLIDDSKRLLHCEPEIQLVNLP